MAELDNVYHLHVEPVAQRPRTYRVRLHRAGTRETWEGGTEETFELPDAVVARCGVLERHPELAEGNSPLGDPNQVESTPETCSPADLGAWLWLRLPQSVQAELRRHLQPDTALRLILHVPPEVSVLPWELLRTGAPISAGGASPSVAPTQHGTHAPIETARWELWRWIDGTVAALGEESTREAGERLDDLPDLQPRVLLLVGSQRQRPEASAAEHIVLDVVAAIREAGFRCDVAMGREQLSGFDREESAWHHLEGVDHVLQTVREGDYDLVHFMGHSDATRRDDQDPLGAGTLLFEIDGSTKELPLVKLADALREAPTRLVVLHACMSRELVAASLLGPGSKGEPTAVDAVAGMGAMAPPQACAAFARRFYATLQTTRSLSEAVRAGRTALADAFPHLAWVPMLWTRTLEPVRLADEESKRIHAYCRWLLATHRAFEGRFEDLPAGLDRVAIPLDVARDRDPTDPRFQRWQRVLAALPADRMKFADLLQSSWRWWTLGGEPGSGKTTSLRLHARGMARRWRRGPIPIYLPLASWQRELGDEKDTALHAALAGAEGLERWFGRYLEHRSGVKGLGAVLTDRGQHGELLLLLDGYDELSPEDRNLLGGILEAVKAHWEQCRVVVATRRYQSARRLPQDLFGDADLCPLGPNDAIKLLGQVLELFEESQAGAAAHIKWFREKLVAGPRLWREVARTPLLVSLLGLQLVDGKDPVTSRLQFFEYAFDVLCSDLHRRRQEPMPEATRAAVLEVLRFLAFRMTVEQRRFATLDELAAWLLPSGPKLTRPTEAVAMALRLDGSWTDTPGLLRFVAERTLILGPEYTNDDRALWRFWHRSFQEALCARWLHDRFVRSAADEARGVARLLGALDRWIGTDRTSGVVGLEERVEAAAAEHRKELERQWNEHEAKPSGALWSLAQREIIEEAWQTPTDVPAARDRRLSEAHRRDPQSYREAVICEAARGRALQEPQEQFCEAVALLADELASTHALIDGLLRRRWQLAYRVAQSAARLEPQTVAPLLKRLPELGQRATVLERLAEATPAQLCAEMLSAIEERIYQERDPGELFGLHRAALDLGRRAGDTGLQKASTRIAARVFERLPDPGAALPGLLPHVPGREHEVDPSTGAPGVRLWRFVPPGEFRMGSEGGGPRGDEKQHRVTIRDGFWIGAVPVTVGLYRLFAPEHRQWDGCQVRSIAGLDTAIPVTSVSWYAAQMFCLWLQQYAGGWLLEHLQERAASDGTAPPTAVRVRLPTEEEWEYAARAGSQTAYFFGDEEARLPLWAWFGEGPNGAPHPVASKRGNDPQAALAGANSWGLFDVHGNVWEWCQNGRETSAHGMSEPRVLRGGSYQSDAGRCRSAMRASNVASRAGDSSGSRVLLSALN